MKVKTPVRKVFLTGEDRRKIRRTFNFILPGLGHLVTGRAWSGLVYALIFLGSFLGCILYALRPLALALQAAARGEDLPADASHPGMVILFFCLAVTDYVVCLMDKRKD